MNTLNKTLMIIGCYVVPVIFGVWALWYFNSVSQYDLCNETVKKIAYCNGVVLDDKDKETYIKQCLDDKIPGYQLKQYNLGPCQNWTP